MRVVFDMVMVIFKNRSKVFVFRMMDSLDDEPIVSREIEE